MFRFTFCIFWNGCTGLHKKGNAYRNISFEKEAYDNENDMDYLDKREHFSWIEYI